MIEVHRYWEPESNFYRATRTKCQWHLNDLNIIINILKLFEYYDKYIEIVQIPQIIDNFNDIINHLTSS